MNYSYSCDWCCLYMDYKDIIVVYTQRHATNDAHILKPAKALYQDILICSWACYFRVSQSFPEKEHSWNRAAIPLTEFIFFKRAKGKNTVSMVNSHNIR